MSLISGGEGSRGMLVLSAPMLHISVVLLDIVELRKQCWSGGPLSLVS